MPCQREYFFHEAITPVNVRLSSCSISSPVSGCCKKNVKSLKSAKL